MKLKGRIGLLKTGDIRRERKPRGVTTLEVDGIVVGEVFASDHYHYEFRPEADWAGMTPAFGERTLGEVKNRLGDLVQ